MRWVFITILCVTCALAACAPAEPASRGVSTAALVATLAPTATALPTATRVPTATTAPTATATATRTLTPAESRASRLPALPNFRWQAKGDDIVLVDPAKPDNLLAELDPKTGGLRWDKEDFGALDTYLKKDATPEDRAALVSWMKELKKQGIHFITFPDTRENFPPYLLVLSADGKDVKMIQARKGTADFVYNSEAKKVMGVFPDGSGYFYLNPDGSFDLAPLQKQANEIAAKLRKDGVIQHPDPAKADFIQQATESAIMINPYGATPQEINEFIKARTGKDFAQHFNETWGNKVGVTYEQVMAATLAKSPKDVFGHVELIGPSDHEWTFWMAVPGFPKGVIRIKEADITSDAYYPLPVSALKETYGSKAYISADRLAFYKRPFYDDKVGARIGEALSFAIQAYTLNQHPEISPHSSEQITRSIDSAFRGGPAGWIPGQPF